VVPRPSWPASFAPQQSVFPALTAHAKPEPAAVICSAEESPLMGVGFAPAPISPGGPTRPVDGIAPAADDASLFART